MLAIRKKVSTFLTEAQIHRNACFLFFSFFFPRNIRYRCGKLSPMTKLQRSRTDNHNRHTEGASCHEWCCLNNKTFGKITVHKGATKSCLNQTRHFLPAIDPGLSQVKYVYLESLNKCQKKKKKKKVPLTFRNGGGGFSFLPFGIILCRANWPSKSQAAALSCQKISN